MMCQLCKLYTGPLTHHSAGKRTGDCKFQRSFVKETAPTVELNKMHHVLILQIVFLYLENCKFQSKYLNFSYMEHSNNSTPVMVVLIILMMITL